MLDDYYRLDQGAKEESPIVDEIPGKQISAERLSERLRSTPSVHPELGCFRALPAAFGSNQGRAL